MALSILTVGDKHGLYDSKTKNFLMTGEEHEMAGWKHSIENAEQQSDNKEYLNNIKKERSLDLINAGYSQEEATQFLKKAMPFLYE